MPLEVSLSFLQRLLSMADVLGENEKLKSVLLLFFRAFASCLFCYLFFLFMFCHSLLSFQQPRTLSIPFPSSVFSFTRIFIIHVSFLLGHNFFSFFFSCASLSLWFQDWASITFCFVISLSTLSTNSVAKKVFVYADLLWQTCTVMCFLVFFSFCIQPQLCGAGSGKEHVQRWDFPNFSSFHQNFPFRSRYS